MHIKDIIEISTRRICDVRATTCICRSTIHSYEHGKLPSIVLLNLVTLRRDPHGQDKSRIDTRPFATKSIEAVSKMAPGITTFHAAGYIFAKVFDRSTIKKHDINLGRKKGVEELLKQFLVEERGLPAA